MLNRYLFIYLFYVLFIYILFIYLGIPGNSWSCTSPSWDAIARLGCASSAPAGPRPAPPPPPTVGFSSESLCGQWELPKFDGSGCQTNYFIENMASLLVFIKRPPVYPNCHFMGPVLSSECVTNCTFNLSISNDDILTFAALLLNLYRNLFQSLVLGRWSIVCLSYELGGGGGPAN